jgi:biopolymer transport protein ExbD
MAVRIPNRGDVLSAINMTPMIDCVFLLLIFFLVATKFEEAEREMNVVLPQASEAMPMTARPKELFVNVTHDGRYIVATQELNAKQLLGAFQQAHANNPGRQTVIIRADKRAQWEYVMAVMNLCNKASIRDYRVTSTQPSES